MYICKKEIMEIFSIVCLVVIIFAIQHLLNWMWRKSVEDFVVPGVMISALSLLISYICIYHIILWGKNLI